MATNGRQPWGNITEVPAQSVPKRYPYARWTPLAEELKLRLEQTPSRAALEIPIEGGAKEAARAASSIVHWFKHRYGKGHVICRQRGDVLYVARGPNYMKGEPFKENVDE